MDSENITCIGIRQSVELNNYGDIIPYTITDFKVKGIDMSHLKESGIIVTEIEPDLKALETLKKELDNSASGIKAIIVHPDFMDRLMNECIECLIRSSCCVTGYQYKYSYMQKITEIEGKIVDSLITIYVSYDNLKTNQIIVI